MAVKKPPFEFAFSRRNYLLLFAGVVIIILGFALMSGGGSDDPNVFKGDYSLNEESFQALTEGQFAIEEADRQTLKSLQGKVFETEDALLSAVAKALPGASDLTLWKVRSAEHIDADIFSGRRITLAPIVVLFGYGFVFFAIMYKEKSADTQMQPHADMGVATEA